MASYRTTVQSTKSPEAAFDYVAQFANAKEWDPGVVEGDNLSGHPIGPGSRFRLVSRFLGRRVPLEYRITSFERPQRVVLEADERMVRSIDEIRFVAVDGGSRVSYQADLRLKGALGRLMDPLLALAFRRIGDRAASGLRAALNR
jgi:hypothetical protein